MAIPLRLARLGDHLTARLARLALRAIARYLRVSKLHYGKSSLLNFARKWLSPRALRSSEIVCLRDCTPAVARMSCSGVGGESPPDILTEWVLYTGRWQPALSRWLCSTLKPGDTFIDVGANLGYFSVLAAACIGSAGTVVAVEACPTTFEKLRANLAVNSPMSRCVRAVQLAASDTRGRTTLYQHRNEPLYNTTVAGAGAGGVPAASDVWSVLQKSAALDASALSAVTKLAAEKACWHEVEVERAALDEVLSGAERTPRVVKIDVEGGEWAVLRGMDAVLAQSDLPVAVVVELSPKWLKLQASSAQALFRHMRERAFHAYALPSDDYEITRCHEWRGPTPRPHRLRDDEIARLDGDGAQLDVIFSRTDAEWL